MPKQIKQMKISQPQNQGKTHAALHSGWDSTRGWWVLVVPQMLCLIGISWVLSCCFLSSSSPLLGSMTTFFYAIPSGRGAGRKEEISPEVLNLSRFDRRLPLPVNSTNNLRNAIRWRLLLKLSLAFLLFLLWSEISITSSFVKLQTWANRQ